MEFMQAIDELSDDIRQLAAKHDNYFRFEMAPEMEGLIGRYVRLMGERGTERPRAYKVFNQGAALAFEEAHPGSMWKLFFHGGDLVAAYTLHGEFDGEEEATIQLHATELGCDPEEIDVDYEQREVRE